MFICKSLLKQFLISAALLLLYIVGSVFLASQKGAAWVDVPVSAFLVAPHTFLSQCVAASTIFSGILLIYFVPGIFIVQNLFSHLTDRVEIAVKGFLVNYFLYYSLWLLYMSAFPDPFGRKAMVFLFVVAVIINLIAGLYARRAGASSNKASYLFAIQDKKFFIFYFLVIAILFFLCREKIFYRGFFDENEGLRQFWTAHSVRYQILPTFYNEKHTILAGFPLAPTIYLNMFAIAMFGENGLSARVEILVAFICIGLILRRLIILLRNGDSPKQFEFVPLFMFLAIYFLIISYRGGYDPPTEIAKSVETPMMALFLAGFFFLLKKDVGDAMPAVMFTLASSVRAHIMLVILFLLIFLKRKRCLLWFLLFSSGAWLILSFITIMAPGQYSFVGMVSSVRGAFISGSTCDQPASLGFFLRVLEHYFVLTAGLSVFFIFTWRNSYGRMFLFTSVFFLLLPLKAIYVPAHFFVPIIFFPLLNYYLWNVAPKTEHDF